MISKELKYLICINVIMQVPIFLEDKVCNNKLKNNNCNMFLIKKNICKKILLDIYCAAS